MERRKCKIFKQEHIRKAWQRLHQQNWLTVSALDSMKKVPDVEPEDIHKLLAGNCIKPISKLLFHLLRIPHTHIKLLYADCK
ncbi:hypothetical protein [Fischerella thermalis]|uniref:hypothetical protein n=1 Tax=Fischerella thermalis TaxID=372787 RepID=UPI0002EAD971|nr:hypothetical protein [Fischerella thermalis]MBF1988164.1 hypothetical protein [Fischerella thermalis M58_A2018_009]MBF2061136.1 hypothetical protein [Fischerella thermalis M66_A2018_004]MBF2068073.1 hypothetical protein [Fischerella thermalis M48_A2018_028]RDH51468.1 hypothetical protein CA946_01285 [Fischerella thermalis 111/344/542]